MCADPGRSFSKDKHAARLLGHLADSHIPREVADLFVDATTFTAAFSGVRTGESVGALERLCEIRTAVVDNLLHCIAGMSDSSQTVAVIDATGPSLQKAETTTAVSFEENRTIARQELERRGSPSYDIKHYYDVSENLIAIELLGEERDPQCVGPLLEWFRTGDGKEKRAAIKSLERIGDQTAAAGLQEVLLAEKDAKTRRALMRALAGCVTVDPPATALVSTMVGGLIDQDATVREVALKWLQHRSDGWRQAARTPEVTATRERLLSMLQDRDINVIYHAVDSLGEVGGEEDITRLDECTRRVKPAAVPRMKEAIKRIRHRTDAV
jgi:hypothetical protein